MLKDPPHRSWKQKPSEALVRRRTGKRECGVGHRGRYCGVGTQRRNGDRGRGGLGIAVSSEDVALLGSEAEGLEHRGPAVASDDMDGAAAVDSEVRLAVNEEEQDLVGA